MPTFGSLFAGIGGIDLGLERAGWSGRWQVEWDEYCQRVLAKHWPDIPRYGDITTVDWSGVERVDLIAGGFPCQPVSVAGRGKGREDDRWLWPEFARAIGALRPGLVLVENVPGLLAGHGMGDVLGGLAALGYDAEWDCIPAAAAGAPHERDRVWIIAYPMEDADSGTVESRRGWRRAAEAGQPPRSDSTGQRSPQPRRMGLAGNPAPSGGGTANHVVDGGWWTTEPDVGRVAHGVPARVDRLRALGNAVVPQVVEVIGRRLLSLSDSTPAIQEEAV